MGYDYEVRVRVRTMVVGYGYKVRVSGLSEMKLKTKAQGGEFVEVPLSPTPHIFNPVFDAINRRKMFLIFLSVFHSNTLCRGLVMTKTLSNSP